MEGAPVVDPHHGLLAVAQVLHFHISGQGQGLVRRRHGVHVVDFPAGGLSAVKLLAIPGGDAFLLEPLAAAQNIIAFSEHLVSFHVAVFAARLHPRHGVRRPGQVRGPARGRGGRLFLWREGAGRRKQQRQQGQQQRRQAPPRPRQAPVSSRHAPRSWQALLHARLLSRPPADAPPWRTGRCGCSG